MKIDSSRWRIYSYEWWKQLKIYRKWRGKDKIQTWENMVIKLRGKYVNVEYILKMCRRLGKLQRSDICVDNYFEEFCIMSMRDGFLKDSE